MNRHQVPLTNGQALILKHIFALVNHGYMKISGSKEKILKKIRTALANKVAQPFPNIDSSTSVYPSGHESLEVLFARTFKDISGNFIYCEHSGEFYDNLMVLSQQKGFSKVACAEDALIHLLETKKYAPLYTGNQLEDMDASLVYCEGMIARTGTVVFTTAQPMGRTLSIYPPILLIVGFTSQLSYDMKDALIKLKEKYGDRLPSMVNFNTGPSRTADIEKTLVTGIHGPKEVYLFLIDENI